jgi:hypothetical protein
MKTTKLQLIACALLALTLGACADMRSDGRGMRADGCSEHNTHCIQVTVSKDAAGQLTIRAEPERLRVRGPSHVIFWRIDNASGQNYTFAGNGIAFKTGAGREQFSCVRTQATVFRCLDPNTVRGEFAYGITLDGSPSVRPLDPWVVNE